MLAIAHGGNWDVTNVPYLSNGAIAAAYASGFDGVKIDVRVTSDNVPVLAHSSPIKFYESLDCVNKRIEQMTAAQVTACHRFPSGTETFQRFDDVLNYLRGKMVAQLTVKESTDYARVIAAVIAAGAEDFAFFEISTNDLRTKIPTISGAQNVWYLINVASNVTEVDELLNTINNPRAFMYEFDPGISLSPTIGPKLTTAGIKAFVYDSNVAASVAGLQGYYNQGFDVVSSQAGNNGVTARQQVNTTRGINPP